MQHACTCMSCLLYNVHSLDRNSNNTGQTQHAVDMVSLNGLLLSRQKKTYNGGTAGLTVDLL